ncbi:MAG: SprT family zinc-dependent metalloprotease [Nitrososphaera sp.]
MISLPLDDGSVLCISVRTSSRARRLRLVCGIRGVEAVVPASGYDEGRLQEFVQAKRDWIIKTASYYSRLREKTGHAESNVVYYLGKRYRVRLVKDRLASAVVSDALGTATFHVTDMRRYKREIEQWYREQTTRVIAERLPALSARLGLAYNKFTVKRQKSRWASCSRKKNLNFNLLISAAPAEVVDYVIVHELCHIAEMNHSKRFWQLVESADPDYRQHKEWLEDHSPVIGVQGL